MKYVFIVIFILMNLIGNAQNKFRFIPYKKKVLIGTSFGFNYAGNKVSNGAHTDVLLTYGQLNIASNSLTINYFNKHLGIAVRIGTNHVSRPSDKKFDEIFNYYTQQFGSQYFLSKSGNNEMKEVFTTLSGSVKGMLGLAYRIEKRKLFFSTSLGISFNSPPVFTDSFLLKEKNTNQVYEVKYQKVGNNGSLGYFILDGMAAYKLLDWLWLKAELSYSLDEYNFSIDKTIRSTLNGTKEKESIYYKGLVNNFYGGLGLTLAF